jgi:hypothetical protein
MLVLEILFAALFVATTILEIAMDWKWHDRRTRVHKGIRWTLILFAIASFVITGTLLIVDNAQKRREEGKRRFSGELISESKIIASSKRGIVPAIQIGKDGPRFFNDYLRMWEEMGVEIRVQAGQIKVSTAIRDRHGNIVADIVDNEWRVNRVLSAGLREEVSLKGYRQRWPASLIGSAARGRGRAGEPAKPTFWRTADEPQTTRECSNAAFPRTTPVRPMAQPATRS